jgi:hypothetical protein
MTEKENLSHDSFVYEPFKSYRYEVFVIELVVPTVALTAYVHSILTSAGVLPQLLLLRVFASFIEHLCHEISIYDCGLCTYIPYTQVLASFIVSSNHDLF